MRRSLRPAARHSVADGKSRGIKIISRLLSSSQSAKMGIICGLRCIEGDVAEIATVIIDTGPRRGRASLRTRVWRREAVVGEW